MNAMPFEVRPLTLPEVRQVYKSCMISDFPDDERKPLSMIEAALSRGEYRCLGAMGEGGVLAYAFFVRIERDGQTLELFDYLAVRRDLRDSGVGSAFLRALCAGPLREADCVLLEVDNPEFAPDAAERGIRERRLRFYLRNGLSDTGVRASVFGVEYIVLTLPVGRPQSREAFKDIYETLYHSFLSDKIYKRRVAVR